MSLGVQEMESSITESNPGGLFRSKSARRERRCVAASSRLVLIILSFVDQTVWCHPAATASHPERPKGALKGLFC